MTQLSSNEGCLIEVAEDTCTSGAALRINNRGAVVGYSVEVRDGTLLQLRGEIFNAGLSEIRIESGALPWQDDILGTDFQAEAGGKALAKNKARPLIGKTGPKVLASNERRQGMTPIGFIFPDLKNCVRGSGCWACATTLAASNAMVSVRVQKASVIVSDAQALRFEVVMSDVAAASCSQRCTIVAISAR